MLPEGPHLSNMWVEKKDLYRFLDMETWKAKYDQSMFAPCAI